jgi:hypothetical protein
MQKIVSQAPDLSDDDYNHILASPYFNFPDDRISLLQIDKPGAMFEIYKDADGHVEVIAMEFAEGVNSEHTELKKIHVAVVGDELMKSSGGFIEQLTLRLAEYSSNLNVNFD